MRLTPTTADEIRAELRQIADAMQTEPDGSLDEIVARKRAEQGIPQ
jgi:hypothetical protein